MIGERSSPILHMLVPIAGTADLLMVLFSEVTNHSKPHLTFTTTIF